MTIDTIIRHLNDMTMDGDLYDSIVAALRAGQAMREAPCVNPLSAYGHVSKMQKAKQAWDSAVGEEK